MSCSLNEIFEHLKKPMEDSHYLLRSNKMLYSEAAALFDEFAYKIDSIAATPCNKVKSTLHSKSTIITDSINSMKDENDAIKKLLNQLKILFSYVSKTFKQSHDKLKLKGNEWKDQKNNFKESSKIIMANLKKERENILQAKESFDLERKNLDKQREKRSYSAVKYKNNVDCTQSEFKKNLLYEKQVIGAIAERQNIANKAINEEVKTLSCMVKKIIAELSINTKKIMKETFAEVNKSVIDLLKDFSYEAIDNISKESSLILLKKDDKVANDNNSSLSKMPNLNRDAIKLQRCNSSKAIKLDGENLFYGRGDGYDLRPNPLPRDPKLHPSELRKSKKINHNPVMMIVQ